MEEDQAREVRRRIGEVLLQEWDPLGVKEIPQAADEYDGYVSGVLMLLEQEASAEELARYLGAIETEGMGLGGQSPERLGQVAHLLQAVYAGHPAAVEE